MYASPFLPPIPDVDADGIVQVDHDQETFGPDTGSIAFEAGRPEPQIYLPITTSTLDTALPYHDYVVKGGFTGGRSLRGRSPI